MTTSIVRWHRAVFALMCLSATCEPHGTELGVLGPVVESGHAATRPDPHGRPAPLFRRIRDGALYERLQNEARSGFTGEMLALDEAAQRIAGATAVHPTWLYLSEEEGGYARSGFWLDDRGSLTFVPDPFVDLVVDDDTIASGEFEEIFAHELGHVLLRRLLPKLPRGNSRTPHSSLSITDEPTAFDEGFAIHFQAVVRRATRNVALRNEELGLSSPPFISYWLSRIDHTERIDGVRENLFVQRQRTMQGEDANGSLARRDFSTDFDAARLKTGNQMLASEGVVATLFYRWLAPTSTDRAALMQRYEPLFRALKTLNVHVSRAPHVMLDLIDAYRAQNADDDERTVAVLIDTTFGATSDHAMARETEQLAAAGRIGDTGAFTGALQPARQHLAELRKAVIATPSRARAALGPAIWLRSDLPVDGDASAPAKYHRTVDLNTAEAEELALIGELKPDQIARAIAFRDRDGAYASFDEFIRRNEIGGDVAGKLRRRMHWADEEGSYPRR